MKYCPDFVLNAASSYSALVYLEKSIELEDCCLHVSTFMNEKYDGDYTELLYKTATFKLRTMLDAKVEDATQILKDHIFHIIMFRENGKKIPWQSLFQEPLKPSKTPTQENALINRKFLAFIFRCKNGSEVVSPQSWNLSNSETDPFLNNLGRLFDP